MTNNNLIKRQNNDSLQPRFTSPIRSLQNQMDSLFRDFFDGFGRNFELSSNFAQNFITPKVNVSEDNKAYYVEAELAGIRKEDVKVECEGGSLVIRAKKEEEENEEKKNYHRTEYSYGSMMRSFVLPDNVDCSKINAKMKDGILKVTLTKTAEGSQKAKEIKVE